MSHPYTTIVANGGGYPKQTTGKIGSFALDLDHTTTTSTPSVNTSDNYMTGVLPVVDLVNWFNASYTIAFWFKLKTIVGSEAQGLCFIGAWGGNQITANSWDSHLACAVRYRVSTNVFSCTWARYTDVSPVPTFTYNPTANVWTHIAFRYNWVDANTGNMDLFVNGTLHDNQTAKPCTIGMQNPATYPVTAKQWLGGYFLDGATPAAPVPASIDRLSVYNTNLSSAAIAILAAQS